MADSRVLEKERYISPEYRVAKTTVSQPSLKFVWTRLPESSLIANSAGLVAFEMLGAVGVAKRLRARTCSRVISQIHAVRAPVPD